MDHLDDTMIAMFIDRRLPDDKASLVERHIDGCPDCRALLAELGRRDPALATGSVAADVVLAHARDDEFELSVGQLVGRYVILGTLGRGGMGAVYSAFDPDLDRKVALKLLRRGAASAGEQARLMREAQALARVSHPSVVAVHDVGTIGDQVFIAMELIAGGTFRTWLEDAPRTWHEVLALLSQVAHGLAAAHATGLVHRDVKPDNILIDAKGRARIGDFGLAFSVAPHRLSAPVITDSSRSVLATSLTITGTVVGTPAYMSPEQFSNKPVTALSDQFSFCVTLFEALYGARPFSGVTLGEIGESIQAGRIVEPATRDVPAWVRAAVVRGLTLDPAGRHPSMEALLAALEGQGRSPRRTLLIAGSAFAVVALAGVGVVAMRADAPPVCGVPDAELSGVWDRARRSEIEAAFRATKLPYAEDQLQRVVTKLDGYTQRWVASRTEACEDTRVSRIYDEATLALRMDCLIDRRRRVAAAVDLFTRADAKIVTDAVDVVGRLVPLEQCHDVSALRELVRPPADLVLRARVGALARELDDVELARNLGKQNQSTIERAKAIAVRTEAVGFAPIHARALFWLGVVHSDLGQVDAAERLMRQTIAVADAARDDRIRALAWSMLISVIANDRGDLDAAIALMPQAEAAVARAGLDDEVEAQWMNARGGVLYAQGDVRGAAAVYSELLQRAEKAGDSPSIAWAAHNLAAVSEAFAPPEEVLVIARRCVTVTTHLYGPKHPEVAGAQLQEAVALLVLGEAADAASLLESSLPIIEGAFGADAPEVADVLVRVAMAYRRLGRLDDSLRSIERARAIRVRGLGAEHYLIAEVDHQLALTLTKQGTLDRALELHRKSIRLTAASLGPDQPFIADAHVGMAQVLRLQGKHGEALLELEAAHALQVKTLGTESPQLAEALTAIGATRLTLGDARGAQPPLERALELRQHRKGDPAGLAQTRLALARVLATLGQKTARARELAEAARAAFEEIGDAKELERATTLLASLN